MYMELHFTSDELNTHMLNDRIALVLRKVEEHCEEMGYDCAYVGTLPDGDALSALIDGIEYDFVTDQPGFWNWLYSHSREYLTGQGRYVILYSKEP